MIYVGRNVLFESVGTGLVEGQTWGPLDGKHHLALGELVVKLARSKMAFCCWVHAVNP